MAKYCYRGFCPIKILTVYMVNFYLPVGKPSLVDDTYKIWKYITLPCGIMFGCIYIPGPPPYG